MSKQSDLVSVSQGSGGDPLYIDTTNDRVGVGTSSPQREVQIHDANATNAFLAINHTGVGSGAENGMLLGVDGNNDAIIHNYENSNMIFRTNDIERMRIDSAGRVTMPYQVGFKASGLTSAPSPPSIIVYNNVSAKGGFNRGGHYSTSTGRFTAPIAGVYLFSANAMGNSTDARLMLRIMLNSADAHQGSSSSNSSQYQDSSVTVALYMNANDYVEVKTEGPKGLHGIGQMEYYFTGLLIG